MDKMPPEKLLNFLVSKEFYQLIDKADEFLKIDPKLDGEKDGKVTLFLDYYFRERLSSQTLKNYAKQILDFLSDEEIDNLLNFIHQNFFDLRENLWQEEKVLEETLEETEETKPETFEEKERRYQEIMEPLIKRTEKTEKGKVEEKTFKTITFQPEEQHPEPESPETLPETIIIIKKTEEEKPKEGEEEFLDLSKL
jgi:hypothetical protein